MIEIELNTTDVTVIDQLRAILRNAIYPVRINNLNQITGVNMSTGKTSMCKLFFLIAYIPIKCHFDFLIYSHVLSLLPKCYWIPVQM